MPTKKPVLNGPLADDSIDSLAEISVDNSTTQNLENAQTDVEAFSDNFFAELTSTNEISVKEPDNYFISENTATPQEIYDLYLSQFQEKLDEFVSAIRKIGRVTEAEFYTLTQEALQVFSPFPTVHKYFIKQHKNNRVFYSLSTERESWILRVVEQANQQCDLEMDELNSLFGVDYHTNNYFELSAKQDKIERVLEELRN